jgi:pseudouridine-5'-phosphate glycosidase
MNRSDIRIQPDVADALGSHRAVVALESTVISHGLPYPDNLATAREMEASVRSSGAVPATIGLLDGQIVVGLSEPEIDRLARSPDVVKVSRRDFAPVLAQGRPGATTVAATMLVSTEVGIRFFATGGIGGVHRGAQSTFDISADLVELSRSPVAVVCAGPKAVLDLGLTLEVLETAGVPIVGYRTNELPAFYCATSGHRIDYCAASPEEIAKIVATQWELQLPAGILIANPPPAETAMDQVEVERMIGEALQDAEAKQIKGKAVTPFLLSYLSRCSNGRTLAANKALLLSNAALAGAVAVACEKITR